MISNKTSHTGNSSPYKNIKKRGLAAINEDNSPSKHPRQMDSDSRPTNSPRAELETAEMDAFLNNFYNSVNKENVNVDDGNKNIMDEKTSPAITNANTNMDNESRGPKQRYFIFKNSSKHEISIYEYEMISELNFKRLFRDKRLIPLNIMNRQPYSERNS
jgi:hypothetical protein